MACSNNYGSPLNNITEAYVHTQNKKNNKVHPRKRIREPEPYTPSYYYRAVRTTAAIIPALSNAICLPWVMCANLPVAPPAPCPVELDSDASTAAAAACSLRRNPAPELVAGFL